MSVDRSRFPRTASFLQGMPNGLESHPECQVVAEAFSDLRDDFPDLVEMPGLPPIMARYLAGEYREKWLPVAQANATWLMVYESRFAGLDEFIAYSRAKNRALFERPAYRALMAVLSPALVAMGARARFDKLYRGMDVSTSGVVKADDRTKITLTMRYPTGLFDDDVLQRRTGEAMLVAVEAAGAKETRMKVTRESSECCFFAASWAS